VNDVAQTLIIAHRGASRKAPENTVPAIQKAIELGADVVALDVQGTSDHEPLVFADTRLDRTTNRTGRLLELTAKEARTLDAGSWFNAEFAGTHIPTLAEAFKALGAKTALMLTLPPLPSGAPLTASILDALKARKKPESDVLVFGDSESLKSFREKAPDFIYALTLGEKVEGWICVEKSVKLGLKTIRPHRVQTTGTLIRQAHEKGMRVLVHFADEEDQMRELLKFHADGIVTGRPERLKRILEEESQAKG
jgi:glycerophosphoryl diester phosphodiesterase